MRGGGGHRQVSGLQRAIERATLEAALRARAQLQQAEDMARLQPAEHIGARWAAGEWACPAHEVEVTREPD